MCVCVVCIYVCVCVCVFVCFPLFWSHDFALNELWKRGADSFSILRPKTYFIVPVWDKRNISHQEKNTLKSLPIYVLISSRKRTCWNRKTKDKIIIKNRVVDYNKQHMASTVPSQKFRKVTKITENGYLRFSPKHEKSKKCNTGGPHYLRTFYLQIYLFPLANWSKMTTF